MKTVETEVSVGVDGRAVIHLDLPLDIPPGIHRAVVVVEEPAEAGAAKPGSKPAATLLRNPYGIWAGAGVDISEEDIAEARREMWRKGRIA